MGAGLSISEETAELATLVKMARVSLLPVVLCVLILVCTASGGREKAQKTPVPMFFLVFFAPGIAANTGLLTQEMPEMAARVSKWLLIIAIAALGAKTSLRSDQPHVSGPV